MAVHYFSHFFTKSTTIFLRKTPSEAKKSRATVANTKTNKLHGPSYTVLFALWRSIENRYSTSILVMTSILAGLRAGALGGPFGYSRPFQTIQDDHPNTKEMADLLA